MSLSPRQRFLVGEARILIGNAKMDPNLDTHTSDLLEWAQDRLTAALDDDAQTKTGFANSRGAGNCGWCGEWIPAKVYDHVKECRRDFETRQNLTMQDMAKRAQEIANELEQKGDT